MAIGSIRMRVGPGYRRNRLAGLLIITAAGLACGTLAGFGFQATNGHRHGFRGEKATSMWVGHRFHPKRGSIAAAVFAIGPIVIMTSGRPNIVSSRLRSFE